MQFYWYSCQNITMQPKVQHFHEIITQAEVEISSATNIKELKDAESKYVGKKGELLSQMKKLPLLPPEERPGFGHELNHAKAYILNLIHEKKANFDKQELLDRLTHEKCDTTLPGIRPDVGNYHILEQTFRQVKRTLINMGFEYVSSPELENFEYNFSLLNYPPNHPAMDEQDTFYVDDQHLLRTQCTAAQGRVLQHRKPPLKIFTLGKTFRNEAVDRTHSHTFHQVDAFLIDKDISLANLKYTLSQFVKSVIGEDVKVRFRPDFFPFVEPGVDYAISSPRFFNGKWLELGGAGLIHPNILRNFGLDPDEYSGFAFGLGLERIPMLVHGIDDLRQFLENDIRFLEQFPS